MLSFAVRLHCLRHTTSNFSKKCVCVCVCVCVCFLCARVFCVRVFSVCVSVSMCTRLCASVYLCIYECISINLCPFSLRFRRRTRNKCMKLIHGKKPNIRVYTQGVFCHNKKEASSKQARQEKTIVTVVRGLFIH